MNRVLLAILGIFFTGYVNAGDSIASLRGITVLATRTARDVFNVAETVSIVNREQILRKQADDIGDLLEDIPGVAIGGGPRNIGQSITIRGLDDSRILFLMDGARQDFNRAHNSRTFLDPELIKQVEVVRGPASAIWGSGALGGVIAFTTKDATDLLLPGTRFGVRVKGGYQSASHRAQGSGSVYGLVGDTFDYLLDFSHRNALSDIRLGDGSNLQNTKFESYSSLSKFNWNPFLNHKLMFSALTFDQTGGVPSNAQIAFTPTDLVDRSTEQRNFTLRYRYENPDNPYLDPEILAFHNVTKANEKRKFDGRHDLTDFTTTGINVRNSSILNWSEGKILQTITHGIDYFHNQAKAKRDGMPRPAFPDAQSDIVGLYMQDEITILKRLTLTPGVRWDYFESQSDGIQAKNNKDDAVSFKIGGVLKITDWLSIIGGYNEAFRAPNVSELFTTGTHFSCGPGCENVFIPNSNLRAEKAFNKEVGLRLQKEDLIFANDNIRFRGTYFHNRVNNFIDLNVNFVPFPVPGNPLAGGVTTSANVRDATLKGFEAELSYETIYGYTGVSYSQTRGKNRTMGGYLSNVQPDRWTVRAGLNWPSKNITLGWRGSIVHAQNRVPVGGTPTPGYTIHNLLLAWVPQSGPLKNIRIDIGIDNLTDEDYRRHLSVLKAPGRSYKTSVNYRF
jgi:hemoglobin/transferrin/lactoferrin receptor protein